MTPEDLYSHLLLAYTCFHDLKNTNQLNRFTRQTSAQVEFPSLSILDLQMGI